MMRTMKRFLYVLMLGLCIPLHTHAMEGNVPHRWYNPYSWVATGKTFINRIFKPIARIVHRPLSYAKTNPKKTAGIIASVGAALVAVCWVGWKKVFGRRAAAVELARAPEEVEMQPLRRDAERPAAPVAAHLRRDIDQLHEELEHLQPAANELLAQQPQLSQEIEQRQQRIQELEAQLQRMQQALAEERAVGQDRVRLEKQLRERIAALNQRIAALETTNQGNQEEAVELRRQLNEASVTYRQLLEDRSEGRIRDEIADLQEHIARLEAENQVTIERLQATHRADEQQLAELTKQRHEFDATAAELAGENRMAGSIERSTSSRTGSGDY